jgi:hypothetical protein
MGVRYEDPVLCPPIPAVDVASFHSVFLQKATA